MKAAEFDYLRAGSLGEVCEALAASGDEERKIIAGGQTLVPLMAMRLARPALLIDINGLDEMRFVSRVNGHVAIGAGTRQRQAELAPEVADSLALLSKALKFVGHQQTRNRGTVGGSIVHGDPSAEIPLVALTLEARLVARDTSGEREIPIDGFFEAPMMTALPAACCLTEVRFPVWQGSGIGSGFHEVASRAGDFALVAAAAQLQLNDDGTCRRAAVAVGGAAPTPVRLRSVEAALTGARPVDAVPELGDLIDAAIQPDSDVHATAEYRRRVARVLVARAIQDAAAGARA